MTKEEYQDFCKWQSEHPVKHPDNLTGLEKDLKDYQRYLVSTGRAIENNPTQDKERLYEIQKLVFDHVQPQQRDPDFTPFDYIQEQLKLLK